jgi:hypothetical protein
MAISEISHYKEYMLKAREKSDLLWKYHLKEKLPIFTIEGYIVHYVDSKWNSTFGSLLVLFEKFGLKMWLKPEQILNYNEIKYYSNKLQKFSFSSGIYDQIQYSFKIRKSELLKYNKKRKK